MYNVHVHTMSCILYLFTIISNTHVHHYKERVERKRAKEEAYKEAEELLRQREMDG